MNEVQSQKFKAVEAAFSAIEKQFGKGSIMRLSEGAVTADVQVVPTGSLSLDLALGIGGIPKGRIVEIYGAESSGKTTLALHCIAECQKKGGVAAFVDAEHALDVSYARKIGVNSSELLVSQPDYGEQALEIVDQLVRSGAIDIIVIDSVAALVPKAEIEGEMGDSHMGLQARLMSQALRKLTGSISKSNSTVVFINQTRMKIGVMFGNPETTTGGNALKFYASVRMDVRRTASIKVGDDAIGNRTRVKVVKNKLAAPFKECEFDVMFGAGISKEGDVLDLGAEAEIIQKSGTWFTYGTERLGQGRENAKNYLREHPEAMRKIESEVRKAHYLSTHGKEMSVLSLAAAMGAEPARAGAASAQTGKAGAEAAKPEMKSIEGKAIETKPGASAGTPASKELPPPAKKPLAAAPAATK